MISVLKIAYRQERRIRPYKIISLIVIIVAISCISIQSISFSNVTQRVIRDILIIPRGVTYRKVQQVSVGAKPTEIHYTKFDPSKGEIQMALHVQEEITSGRYITHTFDFEHGIVWMEDTETGKILKGDDEVFGARILPEEHIERFEEKSGKEVIELTGAGNIGWNDWFVGYIDGQLIASVEEREKLEHRVYSSLVVMKDGSVGIKDLKYEIDEDKVNVIDAQTGEVITDQILYTTFGQNLIKDGETIAPASIYEQFDDIRHILRLPQLIPIEGFRGGGIYLGFDQLYKNEKELVRKALKGETIELNLTIDYENMQLTAEQVKLLKDALWSMGYGEVFSANEVNRSGLFYITNDRIKIKLMPDTLRQALESERMINKETIEMGYKDVGAPGNAEQKGDYAIQGDKLTIKLLDGVYPHHIEAVTESGKVISVVVTGSSGWLGGTLPEITKWLMNAPEFKDDPIVDAVLIDNGNDHMMKVGNHWVVDPSSGTREGRIQAVILLVREQGI